MFNNEQIIYYVLSALAALIILSIHEFAHGYAAYKLGDSTARNLGRLTLNPIKHIDIFGTLCMIVFHFGWAKPVPINARNFKNPKRDFALVAFAGPASNLIMAFLSLFLYLLLRRFIIQADIVSETLLNIAINTLQFIWIFHSINIGLAVFNLFPVPPLDGSRILNVILPTKAYFGIMKYERIIYYVLIAWLLLGDTLASLLLSVPLIASNSVLSAIAGFLSLSDILSYLFDAVSGLMLDFWLLFPFLR